MPTINHGSIEGPNCVIGSQLQVDQQHQFVQQQPYQHHYVHHSLSCYPTTTTTSSSTTTNTEQQHMQMSMNNLNEPQQHYYQYCAATASHSNQVQVASSSKLPDATADYPQHGAVSPSSSTSSSTSTSTSNFNDTSGYQQQQLGSDNQQPQFHQQASSQQQLIDHQLVISSGGGSSSNSNSCSSSGRSSLCNQNESSNSSGNVACAAQSGEGARQELAYSYEEPTLPEDCLAATATSWTVVGHEQEQQQVGNRCEQTSRNFEEQTGREPQRLALEQQQTYSPRQQHMSPSAGKSALALGAATDDYNNNRHHQQFMSMGEQMSNFASAHLQPPLVTSHNSNSNYQCNNQHQEQHYHQQQQQFYSQDSQDQKYQYYSQNEPPVGGTFDLLPPVVQSPQMDNNSHHHHHHHHHQRQSPTSSSTTIHHHQNQHQQMMQQNYDQYQQQLYLHHHHHQASEAEQQQQRMMNSSGDYPTTKSTIHQHQHQNCEQHYGNNHHQDLVAQHQHHQLEGYTNLDQQHHLGHISLPISADYGHAANGQQPVVSTTTTFAGLECPPSGEPTTPTTTMGHQQHKGRPLKGRRGRPRKKGLRSKNKVNGKLWEFIRDLLLSERTNPSFIRWERREDGVFKFVQSDKVAKMWGERKQNPKMTYEKLSRAMRYYYKSKVLLPVFGRRLVYKFGPNATGWMPSDTMPIY